MHGITISASMCIYAAYALQAGYAYGMFHEDVFYGMFHADVLYVPARGCYGCGNDAWHDACAMLLCVLPLCHYILYIYTIP